MASVLAEFTRCSGLSSPNRDTARGWSWLSQYREFQPTSASADLPLVQILLQRRQAAAARRSHLPLPPGMLSRLDVLEGEHHVQLVVAPGRSPAGPVSIVEPGISPTVSRFRASRPTAAFISARNSSSRGPLAVNGEADARVRARRRHAVDELGAWRSG